MKASSQREKGKRLERLVASLLRRKGLDPKAQRTPMSGAMSEWKGDVLTDLPVHIECKNTEKIRFWEFVEQASSQCPMGQNWMLAVSSNHRPVVAVVDIDWLLDLLKIEQKLLEIECTQHD